MRDILVLKEAAEFLRLTPDQVYDLSKRGAIPCVNMTRYGIKMKAKDEYRYPT